MAETNERLVPDIVISEGVTPFPAAESLLPFLRDLSEILRFPGNESCRVEILLTDSQELRQLNRQYRNQDRPTDVLSFPDGDILPGKKERFLGSIVVSVDAAKIQAAEIGHSLEAELKFLVLHGLLHLLGFDHERDNGEMERYQRQLKQVLSIHFGGRV